MDNWRTTLTGNVPNHPVTSSPGIIPTGSFHIVRTFVVSTIWLIKTATEKIPSTLCTVLFYTGNQGFLDTTIIGWVSGQTARVFRWLLSGKIWTQDWITSLSASRIRCYKRRKKEEPTRPVHRRTVLLFFVQGVLWIFSQHHSSITDLHRVFLCLFESRKYVEEYVFECWLQFALQDGFLSCIYRNYFIVGLLLLHWQHV